LQWGAFAERLFEPRMTFAKVMKHSRSMEFLMAEKITLDVYTDFV
jgi:hypothetical protein